MVVDHALLICRRQEYFMDADHQDVLVLRRMIADVLVCC